MAMQFLQWLLQASSDHMRTVSVMAMKFTLVAGPQPVDAHLPQLMPAMLNNIQDQDRYALLPLVCMPVHHTVLPSCRTIGLLHLVVPSHACGGC